MVSAPFSFITSWANSLDDLGVTLYQEDDSITNINPLNQKDMLSSMSYVHSAKKIGSGGLR